VLSPELRQKAEALVDRYPVGRSALLPLLHLVQSQDGMVSDDGIAECAELLHLTKAEVGAVATFYTMYKREPLGRHLVSVCTNFACKVRGAQEVYDRLSERLGLGHNQTTPDGALTLEHAECLGNCEGAPVVTVDYLNYECLTPEMALELVDKLLAGEVPPPTRGFASPGIRALAHRLAGLGPLEPLDGELSVVDTASGTGPERRTQERAAAQDSATGPLHDGADKDLGYDNPEEDPTSAERKTPASSDTREGDYEAGPDGRPPGRGDDAVPEQRQAETGTGRYPGGESTLRSGTGDDENGERDA
jgi:NADH-quinone oxidoreductase subunit E